MVEEKFLDPELMDHLMDVGPSPSRKGRIFLVLILLAAAAFGATQIPDVRGTWYRLIASPQPASLNWRESFQDAVAEAADSGKPLLIVVVGGAPRSYAMINEVWPTPSLRDFANSAFVPLRVDLREQETLATELKVTSSPTVLVFRDAKESTRLEGYLSPGVLEAQLRKAAE